MANTHLDPPPTPDLNAPTKAWLRFTEYHAGVLRAKAKLGPHDRLDPWELVRQLRVEIARPADIVQLPQEDLDRLCAVDARVWSGMGVPLPEGRFLVLLHPKQTPERAAVTVMEEVAHAYFGHRPSQLVPQRSGFARREYNKQIEQEAYWTAAAAMLPRLVVARAVWRGQSAEDLAVQYHVSVELAEFRIKVMRLWPERGEASKARKRAS